MCVGACVCMCVCVCVCVCVRVLIGASLSEPHIDEFAVNFLYIYMYVSYIVP